MEELKRFSEQIVKALLLRQRYMKASLQDFYKPTDKQLRTVSDAGMCNIFEEDRRMSMPDDSILKKKSIAGELNQIIIFYNQQINHGINKINHQIIVGNSKCLGVVCSII